MKDNFLPAILNDEDFQPSRSDSFGDIQDCSKSESNMDLYVDNASNDKTSPVGHFDSHLPCDNSEKLDGSSETNIADICGKEPLNEHGRRSRVKPLVIDESDDNESDDSLPDFL